MENLTSTLSLVKDVFSDVKKLATLEMQLLRAEIADAVVQAQTPALYAGLALVVAVHALFFLGLAVSEGLVTLTSMPRWQSYLIIFAIAAVASCILGIKAKQRSVSPKLKDQK